MRFFEKTFSNYSIKVCGFKDMVVKNDVEQAFSLPVFSSIKIKLTLIFTILSTNSAGTSNSHCIRDACGCEYCKTKGEIGKLDIFIF